MTTLAPEKPVTHKLSENLTGTKNEFKQPTAAYSAADIRRTLGDQRDRVEVTPASNANPSHWLVG